MEINTDLKEILFSAFHAGYKHCSTDSNSDFIEWLKDNENRILALGKPEPLAKNKQTQEYCECLMPAVQVNGSWYECKDCKKQVR